MTTPVAGAQTTDSNLVISQVYGGGGNSGSLYTHDFIELLNPGDEPLSIDGWSVQYASAAGSTWQVTALSGTLKPGQFYLVQGAQGAGGTTPLPTPDATGSIPMAATNGKVALVSSTTALSGTCPSGDNIIDLVGYGSTASCFEGSGPAPTLSNPTAALRLQGGCQDTDDNAADFITVNPPTPRNTASPVANCEDEEPPPPLTCEGEETLTVISTIQGSGATSTIVGQQVVVEAAVTGILPGLSGFYLQEEPEDDDGEPATSEGIFVFTGSSNIPETLEVTDVVRVRGTVAEFVTSGGASSMTQLTGPEIAVCDVDPVVIEPTDVVFPVSSVDELERYEGMLVRLPQDLVISEYFNFDRFGEIVVALPLPGEDRFFTPTAIVEPGAPAQQLAAEYALRRITIDDGNSAQNPDPAIHPGNGEVFDLDNRFRGGDTITGVTGVVDDTFGLYRVHPTEYGTYTEVNLRPESPDEVGGEITVSAFNALNYFLTLDTGANNCGPQQSLGCRGAQNANELERQRAKLLSALVGIDADVVGLIELENTTGVEPMADIVAGLNDILGEETYDYVDTGTIGTDAIKTGFIYRPETVTPVGDHAILDSSVDPRFLDGFNRPALAQTFEENATGARFTATVNHLKSKGSACDAVGDPDTGDGQANCNLTRTAAAEAMVDWLATDPTGSDNANHLIIGDLNAYTNEDPIKAILTGPDDTLGTPDDYTNLILEHVGERAYSFVFDGQAGYLDHALSSSSITDRVTGATEWSINADEPDILDYTTRFKQPPQQELYEPNAFRSSDHDPVIVGLDLLAFDFSGMLPPVSTDSVNHRTAGSPVPLRFDLGGDFGSDILVDGYPTWRPCDGGPETSATLLRRPFVAGGGLYNVRLGTPAAFAGTCQILTLTLIDGSTQTATFEFS